MIYTYPILIVSLLVSAHYLRNVVRELRESVRYLAEREQFGIGFRDMQEEWEHNWSVESRKLQIYLLITCVGFSASMIVFLMFRDVHAYIA